MDIRENKAEQILEIWLSNAEKQDMAVRASLSDLLKQYKGKGYWPVVYVSGPKDLLQQTKDLVIKNRNHVKANDEVIQPSA